MYDQVKIQDCLEHYYVDLYYDPLPIRPILEGVEWDTLDGVQSVGLEKPFSSKEIWDVLSSMEDDKV